MYQSLTVAIVAAAITAAHTVGLQRFANTVFTIEKTLVERFDGFGASPVPAPFRNRVSVFSSPSLPSAEPVYRSAAVEAYDPAWYRQAPGYRQ